MKLEEGGEYLLRWQPRPREQHSHGIPPTWVAQVGALVHVRAHRRMESGPYAGEWTMQPTSDDWPFWVYLPSGDFVLPDEGSD